MSHKKFLLAAFFCGFIILSAAEVSTACVCDVRSVEKRTKESQRVFVGTVIERDRDSESDSWRVKLQIERYWKGDKTRELTIYTGPDDCSVWFEPGKKYLVFAYVDKENGRLETNACMGSGRVEFAEKDLKKLGKGRIPENG